MHTFKSHLLCFNSSCVWCVMCSLNTFLNGLALMTVCAVNEHIVLCHVSLVCVEINAFTATYSFNARHLHANQIKLFCSSMLLGILQAFRLSIDKTSFKTSRSQRNKRDCVSDVHRLLSLPSSLLPLLIVECLKTTQFKL